VCHARVGLAFSTRATAFNNATFTTSVCNALVGLAFSTRATAFNNATLTTSVCHARVGLAFSTRATAFNNATLTTSVCNALVGLAFSFLATTFNNATLTTSVCHALVGLASSTLGTSFNNATLTTSVCHARVGLALFLSTLGTAFNNATLTTSVCNALVGLAFSLLAAAFNNADFFIAVFYSFQRTDVQPIRFTKHTEHLFQGTLIHTLTLRSVLRHSFGVHFVWGNLECTSVIYSISSTIFFFANTSEQVLYSINADTHFNVTEPGNVCLVIRHVMMHGEYNTLQF
jgi:hypothetical protein